MLADRAGERFAAVVLDAEEKRSTVVLTDLAVEARCEGRLTPGERVRVRLTTADPATRTVRFAPPPADRGRQDTAAAHQLGDLLLHLGCPRTSAKADRPHVAVVEAGRVLELQGRVALAELARSS